MHSTHVEAQGHGFAASVGPEGLVAKRFVGPTCAELAIRAMVSPGGTISAGSGESRILSLGDTN